MNIALVLSGGTGTRLNSDIPKQYIMVNGKPIISYCLERIFKHPMIDYVQIVADELWHDFIINEIHSDKFKGFSKPGKNRQLSIYNGLTDILEYSDYDDFILIHDAARPLLSENMIQSCLSEAHKCDGAIPVLPMKDTVYMSENGRIISSLLNREKIFAGQAPEAFHLGRYYKANCNLLPDKILKMNGSTEPAVLYGMNIAMIAGDERNFKITTNQDLERFINIVSEGK